MAGVTIKREQAYYRFLWLINSFRGLSGRVMSGVVKKAAFQLKAILTSGTTLHFVNYADDGQTGMLSRKGGKRMINAKLMKGTLVGAKLTAFPLNLFERGRKGYLDNPMYKYILTKRVKAIADGKVGEWAQKYTDLILREAGVTK